MKIVSIVGARPQFIKLAPVLKAIQKHNQESANNAIEEVLVHTGQHYDYEMSQVFFDDLGLKAPDYHLGVGSGTHGAQTGDMLIKIEQVLEKENPDIVIVYGDTNTTLAGALASVKLHIPVAHVEAGLRSFNKKMPEEINRIITDHCSDFCFCPTETAVNNLAKEGITSGVYFVGDVMYDAVLQYSEIAEKRSTILRNLGLKSKEYALATVHRAENTDDKFRLNNILNGLSQVTQTGIKVIFPVHPRTKKQITSLSLNTNSLIVIEPVSYLDMLVLERNARCTLTDSGGMQKESFFFKVPCITLREETEWPETVVSGWNSIVGQKTENIVLAYSNIKDGILELNAFGDGKAAIKILRHILSNFGK